LRPAPSAPRAPARPWPLPGLPDRADGTIGSGLSLPMAPTGTPRGVPMAPSARAP